MSTTRKLCWDGWGIERKVNRSLAVVATLVGLVVAVKVVWEGW